jgi:hypothetical protein
MRNRPISNSTRIYHLKLDVNLGNKTRKQKLNASTTGYEYWHWIRLANNARLQCSCALLLAANEKESYCLVKNRLTRKIFVKPGKIEHRECWFGLEKRWMSSIAPMHGPSQVIQRNIAMNICFSMMDVSTLRFSFFRLSFGGVGCLVSVVLDESQILLLCCYSVQTGIR